MGIKSFIKAHLGPGWNLINYSRPHGDWLGVVEKGGIYIVFHDENEALDYGGDLTVCEFNDRVEADREYATRLNDIVDAPEPVYTDEDDYFIDDFGDDNYCRNMVERYEAICREQ